jgi:hypothetical protein
MQAKRSLQLKKYLKENCDDDIDACIENGFQWLYEPNNKIPSMGWRFSYKNFNRVGSEATAYVLLALLEYNTIDKNFNEGFEWLLYSQQRNGTWSEYFDVQDKKFSSIYPIYNLSLVMLVLTCCLTTVAKNEILAKNFSDKILEENLVLRAKLSALTYSKLLLISKRPLLVFSYPIALVIILLILSLIYIEKDYIMDALLSPEIAAFSVAIGLITLSIGVIRWFKKRKKR